MNARDACSSDEHWCWWYFYKGEYYRKTRFHRSRGRYLCLCHYVDWKKQIACSIRKIAINLANEVYSLYPFSIYRISSSIFVISLWIVYHTTKLNDWFHLVFCVVFEGKIKQNTRWFVLVLFLRWEVELYSIYKAHQLNYLNQYFVFIWVNINISQVWKR